MSNTNSSGFPFGDVKYVVSNPNREQYERDLAERQKRHLERIRENQKHNQSFYIRDWQPCAHNSCTQCVGTGVKADGSMCIHMISCTCPRCTPRF